MMIIDLEHFELKFHMVEKLPIVQIGQMFVW